VITGPWLGLAFRPPTWKLIGGRILADLWPTLPIPARLDPDTLSRDPAVNQAYAEDAAVHSVMTPGAWREIQWAQRAVVADGYRIEPPLLVLLVGQDREVDAHQARAFAGGEEGGVRVRRSPAIYHEVRHEPARGGCAGAGGRVRGADRAAGGSGGSAGARGRGSQGQVTRAGRGVRQFSKARGQGADRAVRKGAGRSRAASGGRAR